MSLAAMADMRSSLRHGEQTASIKEFRCYEVKIEESEKASSCQELNPGYPWLELPSALPLSHDIRTTTNSHDPFTASSFHLR